MRVLRLLLRHRVTRWWRDPTWGLGTVAGQAAVLGLFVIVMGPLGVGSYVVGDVLRALFPTAEPLRLINGGMLALLPLLAGSRFLFETPPSGRMARYVALPLSPRGLLHGQALLSLPSVYTVMALVLVLPVWTAEVWGTLAPTGALAWLATALLLTAACAGYGARLLHLLLGRRPRIVFGGLGLLAGFVGADAVLGPDLFRGLSRALFGHPVAGAAGALVLTAAMHGALVWAMRVQLTVDRSRRRRSGGAAPRGGGLYRWMERTLPVGQLMALTLRQVTRTRRLRGMMLYASLGVVALHGWGAILATGVADGSVEFYLILACTTGIGGAALGLAPIVFGVSSGHADALFARPHRPTALVWTKLVMLWVSTVPGSVLVLGVGLGLPASQAAFLVASVLWWWGVIVPVCVWIGVYAQKPVDLSASHFSLRTNSLYELPVILLGLSPMWIYAGIEATGYWWSTSAGMGALGLIGLFALVWTDRPLAQRLRARRHEMMAGFRENEPV